MGAILKALVFDQIGSPLEVLYLDEVSVPEIKDNEVLVQMTCASINPGDFLFTRSLYPEPKKPQFPRQIAGNAGVGIIVKVGRAVSLKPGTLVTFYYVGAWAEYAALPAAWVIPLPADCPPEKASQFHNAITAWDLFRESGVQPGQWLALTAGNSSVATKVLQFANLNGVNVICIVRRPEEELDLLSWGASAVLDLSVDSGKVGERIGQITGDRGIHAVIDCVGGPVLADLIRSLVAWGGQVIIYGGYLPERFELHNFDVLMKGVTIKPYAYRYFFTPPDPRDAQVLEQIAAIFGRRDFKIRVGGVHSLEDFKVAIEETATRPERGKRFFRMDSAHRAQARDYPWP